MAEESNIDIQRVLDGVMNCVTLMGSRVDPNEGNTLVPDRERDRLTWYKNGGLADKIANFWSDKIGTGLEISIAAKQSGRGQKDAAKLRDWLQSEYERLDVLGTLKLAQLQCYVDRAAPILVLTNDTARSNQSPSEFDRVVGLKICNPEFLLPCEWLPVMRQDEPISHQFVTSYRWLIDSTNPNSIYHADRVLALQGRKLTASSNISSGVSYLDLQWGLPLISSQTIEAAIKYDVAIDLSMVLLHKKNMMVHKFKDLFKAMTSPNAEELLGKFTEIAKRLQVANNITNVALADLDLTEIAILDRNLSEVANIVDRIKDYLLASCPNIPQSHLFGRQERTGGLSASNNENEDINAQAELLYRERWLPLLGKLNRILLRSDSCPVKGATLGSISVLRKSGFTPDPIDTAKIRLTYSQIDSILLRGGAIDAREMRSRHVGTEFRSELLLESPDIPPSGNL